MQVTLIATTVVDWPAFINSVLEGTGRSPTRKIDEYARPVDHLAAYLAALDCIKNPNSDPIKAIKTAEATLEHISLTFVIEASDREYIYIVEMRGGITVTVGDGVLVCTATLGTWRSAIIEAMKPTHPKPVRQIFNIIYLMLRRDELSNIFDGYGSKRDTDGTLLLEEL